MANNRAWNLESFLDSLVMELDKANDTLAFKGFTRKSTYAVKDVALELQIFPQYTGDEILFSTAQPGQSGASKVSIQFGSITDRQIREHTKEPATKDQVSIDLLEELDPETKKTLNKIGVTSDEDLKKMEERNIDLEKVVKKKVNYQDLANVIGKARRSKQVPTVNKVSMSKSDDGFRLAVDGDRLVVGSEPEFPVAFLNNQEVAVISASDNRLELAIPPKHLRPGANQLAIALDRYSILRMNLEE
jgi:hypothetical protein